MTTPNTFNTPSGKARSLTIQTSSDRIVYAKTHQPNIILPIDGGCFGSVTERRRGQRRRAPLSVDTHNSTSSPSTPLSPHRVKSRYNQKTPTRMTLPTPRRPPTKRTPSDNLLTFKGMDQEFTPPTAATWSARVRILMAQRNAEFEEVGTPSTLHSRSIGT
ncbi:hypothetical protein BDZ85DRAFT_260583 [Elsinoe ampelina]|uniref:Uncharacterized protein n=1 Tax=Elsinoe ampelina TaxID=302913 RepID=A0A6A6GFC4_9PEZI|nr:hypothetical protein BDZ85DRAFT_260583 [Elsinoe ampelina]